MLPEAEEHEDGNPDEQSDGTDVNEAGHVEGGDGKASNRNGVDHDGDEEDDEEMPELLDADVEEATVPGTAALEYLVRAA